MYGPAHPSSGHPDPDVVHRYVAGTLSRGELEVFEQHLVTCGECQRAVREGAAIRSVMRELPPLVHTGATRGRRPFTTRSLVWVVTAAAATLVLVFVATRGDPVRRLGRVDSMPGFQPLQVRTAEDVVDRLVDSAMAAYAAVDYARAASILERVSRDRHAPSIAFFLGVARLGSGDANGAREPLRHALVPDGNPYAAEARYYLAKASLQLGYADSAVAQLRKVPPGSAIYRRAAALMDSVRSLDAR